MFKLSDLPETIPVFPLPGALLLPRSRLPLHIFEPQYRQMLEDCLKTEDRLIGMIQPYAAPDGKERLYTIGCAGRVVSFSETPDRRFMITLLGVSRFRIKQEVSSFNAYRRYEVSWGEFETDLGPTQEDPGFSREPFLEQLGKFLTLSNLSLDWESLEEAKDELLINSLSMVCPFEPEDKQALLEAPSLTTRREALVTLIEFALRPNFPGNEEAIQ